jgi:outer membrane protein OmpA-like peptidoglycan-associated protein
LEAFGVVQKSPFFIPMKNKFLLFFLAILGFGHAMNAETNCFKITVSVDTLSPELVKLLLNSDEDLDLTLIYFKRGTNLMTKNSEIRLQRAFDFLKRNPSTYIGLNGYTDVLGDDKKNIELSLKRAITVREVLLKWGMDSNRIIVRGLGGKNPMIKTPLNEAQRAINRRVEFTLESIKGKPTKKI